MVSFNHLEIKGKMFIFFRIILIIDDRRDDSDPLQPVTAAGFTLCVPSLAGSVEKAVGSPEHGSVLLRGFHQ